MKAIINGKRYDTEAATHLATASSPLPHTDFAWWEEDLYQTKRSKVFFLAGEGNARSHYAVSLGGGSWGPGAKITPMTKAEALAWCERNLTASTTESIFGDDIEEA